MRTLAKSEKMYSFAKSRGILLSSKDVIKREGAKE